VSKSKKRSKKQVVGFLGVGLDNSDGHQRLTQNEHFLIVGGSEETHERMQEVSIRFNESLEKRGTPLPETPVEEVIEIFYKSIER
jgi:hypothetical protein